MSDREAWRRIPLDVFNQGDLGLVDQLFAPGYVEHVAGLAGGTGRLKDFVLDLRTAFPDLRMRVVEHLTVGTTQVGVLSVHGTMTGSWLGHPPTGRRAVWQEIHVDTMTDGQVTKHYGVVDRLGMLEQLGFQVTPGPDPATATE